MVMGAAFAWVCALRLFRADEMARVGVKLAVSEVYGRTALEQSRNGQQMAVPR